MTENDGDDIPRYRATVLRELDQIHGDVRRLEASLARVEERIETGIIGQLIILSSRVTTLEADIAPLKKLVWGMVGIICSSTLLAMIALVIRSGAFK